MSVKNLNAAGQQGEGRGEERLNTTDYKILAK